MLTKFNVTFEFDEAAPITVRGVVEASNVKKLAWRAVEEAVKQKPGLHWQSMVILLDRKDLDV